MRGWPIVAVIIAPAPVDAWVPYADRHGGDYPYDPIHIVMRPLPVT